MRILKTKTAQSPEEISEFINTNNIHPDDIQYLSHVSERGYCYVLCYWDGPRQVETKVPQKQKETK